MKSKLFLLPLLLSPIALISCSKDNSNKVQITSVHDGDTFTDSSNHIYRLFGVDTPEASNQYDGFSVTNGIEKIYANAATQLTEHMILNKKVNVNEKSIDRYSRHVAIISVDGKDLAYELISHGLARVAYFNVVNQKDIYFSNEYSYYEKLIWAQHDAYINHLGVWRDYSEFKTIFPKA